jgi:hypothetical protein
VLHAATVGAGARNVSLLSFWAFNKPHAI